MEKSPVVARLEEEADKMFRLRRVRGYTDNVQPTTVFNEATGFGSLEEHLLRIVPQSGCYCYCISCPGTQMNPWRAIWWKV